MLALLPMLLETNRFQHIFVTLAAVFFGLASAAFLFRTCGFLFPKRLERTALILWITFLAQAGWYLWDLKPFWAMSLYWLAADDILDENPDFDFFSFILNNGFGFGVVLIYLGVCGEVLGEHLSLNLFRQSAGSLLLLAFAAFLWQNFLGAKKKVSLAP